LGAGNLGTTSTTGKFMGESSAGTGFAAKADKLSKDKDFLLKDKDMNLG